MLIEEIAVDDVLLVPVAAERVADILAGDLDGRHAGRGWPHADTPQGLAFAAEFGGLTWLIVDGDGAVVGELGTKAPPDAAGRVEIGYGLAGPSRGRRLGTRSVAAMVDWLRARPEVSVIEARVDPTNTPSVSLLRRLGFVLAGHERGEDAYELAAPPPWRRPRRLR
jgi:RimJ/RimL family protein N-acetyltransferase